jgi:hypothetical protein
VPVERAAAAHSNAEVLSRALARSRRADRLDPEGPDRSSHDQAIDHLVDYVNMLRAAGEGAVSYPLKLELEDGRWDVAESSFPSKPRIGDRVSLASGSWRVRGSQFIRPSVAGKPAREFIVCAPA